MRDILFKAKRSADGEWIEGWLSKVDGEYIIEDGHGLGQSVMSETVCQYTGLNDKNGRVIFEGDILMCHSNKNDLCKAVFGEFYVIDVETLERVEKVAGWHYEVLETDALSKCEPFCIPMPLTDEYIARCEMEVVGNIFDNPELLEVRE